MSQLPSLCAVLLLSSLCAAQGYGYNRLDFGNSSSMLRDDRFPNAATSGGIQSGDALFRVLPAEILDRGDVDHRISGYRMVVSVHQGYTGLFPAKVSLPAVELLRTTTRRLGSTQLGQKEYEVPDPSPALNIRFGSLQIDLPKGQAYAVELRFEPQHQDPSRRNLVRVPARVAGKPAGLALKALGTVGETTTLGFLPSLVMRSSYQEKHRRPWRDSYSGSVLGKDGSLRMFGMLGQPSRSGELQLGLLFDNPTLSLYGSMAGGLPSSKTETRMGVGAYGTDLSRSLGQEELGWFVQSSRHQASGQPSHLALPLLVGAGPLAPNGRLRLAGAEFVVDRTAQGLWALPYEAGLFGPLARIPAQGRLGFASAQAGAWGSRALSLPRQPVLLGQFLWFQAAVLPLAGGPIEASNLCRMTF